MKTFFIALFSIAMSVAAQYSLKAGMSSSQVQEIIVAPLGIRSVFALLMNKHVLLGFLLYGLGAVVWLAVLAKWDVSKAYPMVGLGFVFTVAIGYLIGEGISISRAVGVTMICVGVILVGKS